MLHIVRKGQKLSGHFTYLFIFYFILFYFFFMAEYLAEMHFISAI